MNNEGENQADLIREYQDLKDRYNSLKELYEKEISGLRQSYEDLRRGNEIFRTAYMTSPDSININRLSDGIYVSVNEGFTKMFGYTEKEVVGKSSGEVNIWFNPEDLKNLMHEIKAKGKVKNFETKFLAKNGTVVYGRLSASLANLDGTPHILTILKDSTKRKKAEEALAKEQFLINALMNNLSDHVYFKDLESRFIKTNRSHAQSFGLDDPEKVIGKSDFDFFTREAAQKAFEDEQEIIKTGKPILKEEKLTRKDSSNVWFSVIKMPLRDNDGNIIGTFGISRDISELKNNEEQLFLIANALKSINECVSITDINDHVLFLNQAFLNTYGFDENDLKEKAISIIRSPNNPSEVVDKILPETLLGGWQGEVMNRRKDGTEFPVFLSTAVVKNTSGQPVALIGVAKDITETKKTEAALKQSEERFRSVAQSANDAIITTDSNGLILGWNRGAINIFGFSEAEIMGQSLNLIIPDDYQILHERGMKRLESGGEKHVIGKTVELIGITKEHASFPLELSLSEWETSEGKFFTGIVRDISRRKRTELENKVLFEITQGVTTTSNLDELLKLIHHSLGEVVSAENCFIALYDQHTGLFSFPYFVDKYDVTPTPTLIGKSCTSYVFRTVKPLVLTQKIFDMLVEKGEMELIGSNSPSWIGIPLQTPSRVIGVLVLQNYEKENVYSENDINFLISTGSQIAMAIERKKAEEEINYKNKQLQALNAEKDKFFSIIAHDLKGPLSAFVDATQIISEEILNMDVEEIKDITNSMKNSATNIYGLLENLLEWSRLRRGGLDFIPVKLDLNQIVNECINVLSESARKKEIRIDASIPDGTEVFADHHMFETIIRNLVSNAIKFTNQGGSVKITADKTEDLSVEIRISDTGIGISSELKSKLFQLDEKTSRTGTDGEPSTGLGLLLCKEFIEKHGGKIWVDSEQGKGSVFSFTIKQI
jgi:PAS domain S-box-containing protein